MLKKTASKTIDINTQIVEELLSKSEPSELFGKDGIFNQLKKQIVERVLEKELDQNTEKVTSLLEEMQTKLSPCTKGSMKTRKNCVR